MHKSLTHRRQSHDVRGSPSLRAQLGPFSSDIGFYSHIGVIDWNNRLFSRCLGCFWARDCSSSSKGYLGGFSWYFITL